MNALELNLNLVSNKLYDYFWRSPTLFVQRIENRLQTKLGWRPHFSPAPTTHALCWALEEANFHTRYYLFNYWTDHYGLTSMPIVWEMRDSQAHPVASGKILLAPREMRVLEVRDLLREGGLSAPFLGSITLTRQTPGAGFGAPLKTLQEYYSDSWVSAIHEYGEKVNFAIHATQGGVTLDPASYVDNVEIGIINCNHKTKKDSPLALLLTNAFGQRHVVAAGTLGAGHVAKLSLNHVWPAWKSFLKGQLGNIGLDFPNSVGRPLVFHRYTHERARGLNHMTQDKTRTPAILQGIILEHIGAGPVWVSAVSVTHESNTEIVFIQNFGFHQTYNLKVQIFDRQGILVKEYMESVPAGTTHRIDIRQQLGLAESQLPWIGSVRFFPIPDPKNKYLPQAYEANTEFVGKGWRQAVFLGSSLLNVPKTQGVKSSQLGRTKNFMRLRNNELFETFIAMVNHSSASDYPEASDTILRLISADGTRESTRSIKIPPQGTFFENVASIFPDYQQVVGPGNDVATLHIRDTKVKLIGIHILRNKKTGVISTDHYFGG